MFLYFGMIIDHICFKALKSFFSMIQKLIFTLLAISLLGCFFDNPINQTKSLSSKHADVKALKASRNGLPLKEAMIAFNDFVKALSTNQNISTESPLHDQAKLYFPDSTIYSNSSIFEIIL